MYRKNKSLLIVLLVLGFAFSQAPKSFALSWGLASATNPPDYCGGTMTIDKASYKPGETVTFSTEGTCNDYAPLNVDISELFTTSVVFTHIGKGQVGNPNIVPLSVPIGANLGTNYFTMNISVFDGMGAETSDVFDVPYEVTGCDAGWGDEELAFDGWAGSGPGWCAGTSYGACDAATVTGSHEPSAKGSITFCCRGSGQYGWTRTCGYSPPTPTVNLCFGAACP